jgi:hypothetical protein
MRERDFILLQPSLLHELGDLGRGGLGLSFNPIYKVKPSAAILLLKALLYLFAKSLTGENQLSRVSLPRGDIRGGKLDSFWRYR